MKFKVCTYSSAGYVGEKKIHWIKEFREQTGVGLKEAKDVADWLTNNLDSHRSFLILDTRVYPQFHFLTESVLIEVGRPNMISRIKPVLSRPTATVELERVATKLIKLGDYKNARAVLKILVNAH